MTESGYNKFMKNEAFIDKVKKSGKTIYQIAKETGISYTTLSELKTGKSDINRVSAGTVAALAGYFGCSVYDLLHKTDLLSGTDGIYRGVRYHLVIQDDKNGTLKITLPDGNPGPDIEIAPYLFGPQGRYIGQKIACFKIRVFERKVRQKKAFQEKVNEYL